MNARAPRRWKALLHNLAWLLAGALVAISGYAAWRGYFTPAMLMDWAVRFCG